MSLTLEQIYTLNPSTTIANTDLFYMVHSPYTPGNDTAILGSDLKALFAPAAGSTSIVTLGTITTGTWHATPIQTLYGGTGLTSYTLGDTLYASATNTLARLAGNITTTKNFLSQTGTGVVSAAPIWTTISASDIGGGQALTKTDDTNVTLTLGGSPTTALLAATSLTLGWTGTLSGTRGGTGVNNGSSTITIGGNVAFSGAFTFTGTLTGNTSVTFPTSGTLATTSQIPTGAALTKTDDTNVTLTLGGSPTTALVNAASLTLGWTGTLSGTRGGTGVNNGSSTITIGGNVTFSGAFTFTGTITANTSVTFPTSGTLATTSQIPTGAALTKTDDTNVTLTLGGSPTTALVNAASLTLGWTGQLGLTRGGTAASLTASNGGIVYSTSSALAILSGTATAGLALLSGASGAPSWSTSPPITQINIQAITSTGAFTYTATSGTKYAIFKLQGAGGGSGGSTGAGGQGACGGPGGGGAYMEILVSGTTNLGSITGSVGAAGTAASSGNNNGGDGSDTTLVINGGSTWTAGGGKKGNGMASTASAYNGTTGGAGGTNTTGSNGTLIVNIPGQNGCYGCGGASGSPPTQPGVGGDSFLGKGGVHNQAGVNYGGGGGAQSNTTGGSVAGFAGAQGAVIVIEFISV